ncbi:hypothetical protein Q6A49_12360 [Pseudomonas sp. 22-AL-CL-001]|uniref:hypothetical protein n=1 Tax=Pseudomonas alabamensis TaxID=3064349 RepID=UPI00271368B0|nr:hypothetical protein [Pseudomonas sp. 22-AL-CL-001]MDO7911325.1 hypothetical protein [Pseudomonas sp. 22-AL-CL-001]
MTQASKKVLSENLKELMDLIAKAAKEASALPQKSISDIAQKTFNQINAKHSELSFTTQEIEKIIQIKNIQNWCNIKWATKIDEWESLVLCCDTIPVTRERLEYLRLLGY